MPEQESKRRGPTNSSAASSRHRFDLSEGVRRPCALDSPLSRRNNTGAWTRITARRQSLLLDALSACGSTQNDGPAGERSPAELYGVLHSDRRVVPRPVGDWSIRNTSTTTLPNSDDTDGDRNRTGARPSVLECVEWINCVVSFFCNGFWYKLTC
jgi:hypothetical protein